MLSAKECATPLEKLKASSLCHVRHRVRSYPLAVCPAHNGGLRWLPSHGGQWFTGAPTCLLGKQIMFCCILLSQYQKILQVMPMRQWWGEWRRWGNSVEHNTILITRAQCVSVRVLNKPSILPSLCSPAATKWALTCTRLFTQLFLHYHHPKANSLRAMCWNSRGQWATNLRSFENRTIFKR